MLIILFVLLAAALSLIPWLTDRRWLLRAVLVTECVLCAVGVLCVILSSVFVRDLLADTALTEEYRGWAGDMYGLWARGAGILAGVTGGCVLLAALIRHPLQRIRTAVAAAVFVILPILGQAYLTVAADDLVTPLTLWTVGCACLVRLGPAVDAFRFRKVPPRVKNFTKKKKRP